MRWTRRREFHAPIAPIPGNVLTRIMFGWAMADAKCVTCAISTGELGNREISPRLASPLAGPCSLILTSRAIPSFVGSGRTDEFRSATFD